MTAAELVVAPIITDISDVAESLSVCVCVRHADITPQV